MARFNDGKSPPFEENDGFKREEIKYYDEDKYFGNTPKIKKILNIFKDRRKFVTFTNADLGAAAALQDKKHPDTNIKRYARR